MIGLGPSPRLVGFLLATSAAGAAGVLMSPPAPATHVTFGHELTRYAAEKPQFRKLPDGGRIAIGSRTGHDVSVQWQDAATRTWTAPQTVHHEKRFWTHDITVQRLGPTVAVAPDYWTERVLDDDYAPSFTAVAVCREYRCERPHSAEHLSGPELAEGGDLVAFALNDTNVLLWENGTGYRRASVTGIPRGPGEYRVTLLSDGTFVGVASRWSGAQCHYDLYVGGHRSPTLHKELESPGFADLKPCYLASVDATSDNQVDVWIEALSDDITFRRTAGRWAIEPRGLTRMQIQDTHGKRTLAPIEATVGRRQALFGSPDMRRILHQHRPHQDAPWSDPRVIAQAPAGTLCRHGTRGDTGVLANETGPAATLVLVHCYDAGRPPAPGEVRADVGLVFASDDGVRWHRAQVKKPRWEPLFSNARLVAAGTPSSVSYEPGKDSFDVIQLPLGSEWDGLGLSLDGRHVLRIPGNSDPHGVCTASWSYAAITADAWPQATSFAVDGLPRPGTCSGSANADAPGSFMVGLHPLDWSWEGMIRIVEGKPELAPPPD